MSAAASAAGALAHDNRVNSAHARGEAKRQYEREHGKACWLCGERFPVEHFELHFLMAHATKET